MNWIIVVAGGDGERMHLNFNKVFLILKRHPILYWTLRQLESSPAIDKVLIATRAVDIPAVEKLIKNAKFTKVTHVFEGGSSRQNSVYLVLRALKKEFHEDDLIGIHNAVNPFVNMDEIEEVFLQAKENKAALLAQPARDTVKMINDNGEVDYTPLREKMWCAQTPQVAQFKHLWDAFEKAIADDFCGTDDTQLLEHIGIKAKIVPCSSHNIKLTYPEDMELAKLIIKQFS